MLCNNDEGMAYNRNVQGPVKIPPCTMASDFVAQCGISAGLNKKRSSIPLLCFFILFLSYLTFTYIPDPMLNIHLEDEHLLMTPAGCILRGVVELNLDQPTKLRNITLRLTGQVRKQQTIRK